MSPVRVLCDLRVDVPASHAPRLLTLIHQALPLASAAPQLDRSVRRQSGSRAHVADCVLVRHADGFRPCVTA